MAYCRPSWPPSSLDTRHTSDEGHRLSRNGDLCVPIGRLGNLVNPVIAYYFPYSKTEATFNLFYYDAESQQATLIQLTISNATQAIQRGVKGACFVESQSVFDLLVPTDFGKEKYHLVV